MNRRIIVGSAILTSIMALAPIPRSGILLVADNCEWYMDEICFDPDPECDENDHEAEKEWCENAMPPEYKNNCEVATATVQCAPNQCAADTLSPPNLEYDLRSCSLVSIQ